MPVHPNWTEWGESGHQRCVRGSVIWYVGTNWGHDPGAYLAILFRSGKVMEEFRSPRFEHGFDAMKWADEQDVSKVLKPIIGWRIKTTEGRYVHRVGEYLKAEPGKGPLLRRSEMLRLLADWIDCGYKGRIFRVLPAKV